jgi:ASPIC/UnbV protein
VGLGASEAVDDVVVEWPDAARESFGGQRADRILMLMKGTGRAASPADSR